MRLPVVALSIALLASTACSADRSGSAPAPMTANAPRQADAAKAPSAPGGRAEAEAVPVSLQDADRATAPAVPVERKIIRNAELTLELDDPADAQRRVAALAETSGGFVVTSESRQYDEARVSVTVTMRVPSERFGDTVEAIRKLGARILAEKVTGQDVTEEYIDLQARIRTKQALEQQFLEILKQAKTVSEALEVQRQVADVRTEIERLEGRRRFLENQAALSTIVVNLRPVAPIVSATGTGLMDSVRRALRDAVDTALAIVIGFIRLLGVAVPVILLIGVPVFFVLRWLVRRVRRRFRQSAAVVPEPSEATPPPA